MSAPTVSPPGVDWRNRWKNDPTVSGAQKPLELILARNLLTSIATPAFLVARDGAMLFYNEAAGALLGVPFEESGRMEPGEWTSSFGPFDDDGEPIAVEDLELTLALRDGRPAHCNFSIRSAKGTRHEIAASGMPIVSAEHGASGAIVFFWPLDPDHARQVATGSHETVG
jgi:PAS domain-containing protein